MKTSAEIQMFLTNLPMTGDDGPDNCVPFIYPEPYSEDAGEPKESIYICLQAQVISHVVQSALQS